MLGANAEDTVPCLTAWKPLELKLCPACTDTLSPGPLLYTCKGPECLVASQPTLKARCEREDAWTHCLESCICCRLLSTLTSLLLPVSHLLLYDLQGIDVWPAEIEKFHNLAADELRKGPRADKFLWPSTIVRQIVPNRSCTARSKVSRGACVWLPGGEPEG